MVNEARKHLGYRESGNNDTKFNRWLGPIGGYPHGGYGYPWCHAFMSYCLDNSGNAGAGPKTAGCLQGVAWFKQRGRWHSQPRVGDLVYFGANGGTHVELVVGVTSSAIRTVGGNTGGSMGGAYFNGDGVYEKQVARTSRVCGYGRPEYASDRMPRGAAATAASVDACTDVRSIKDQQKAVNRLGRKPPLDVDGEWGPRTEAGVSWLQKRVGAESDGEWGPNTEAKFKAYVKAHP
jgi:uncharacterized protein (TIGR02594 family)